MEFDHEKHHHTDIHLISASEEVIETLEDNQVSSIITCVTNQYHNLSGYIDISFCCVS